jgi:hypothetical protein
MATPPAISHAHDRISAGVAAGIITPDQAMALRKLPLDSMPEQFAATRTGDEPFALFRGFRDVFLAIGIVILAVGLTSVAGQILGMRFDLQSSWTDALFGLILAIFAWIVAEWVTGRLRMPLASLVTALAFSAAFAATLVSLSDMAGLRSGSGLGIDLLAPVFGAIGALLFYIRFRLPAAMLLIAGGLSATILRLIDPTWFDSPGVTFQIAAFVVGLVIFAVAISYELRDPQRVQRQSENAFWLHLLAAPLIVFALTGGATSLDVSSTGEALRMFAVVFALGLLALLIDRRAFIVSALLYLAGAIAYTVNQSGAAPDTQFAITALALGLFVVGLALGWQPLRQAFLKLLPDGLSDRLPKPTGPDALGG